MWKDLFCAGMTRHHWRRMAVLMTLYLGTILFAVRYMHAFSSPFARAATALAPVVPVIGFVVLEFRRIRATDELRQRIEFEASMIALAVGVPLLLALGLLDDAGVVQVGMSMAAPILIAVYVPAQMIAHWRYR